MPKTILNSECGIVFYSDTNSGGLISRLEMTEMYKMIKMMKVTGAKIKQILSSLGLRPGCLQMGKYFESSICNKITK